MTNPNYTIVLLDLDGNPVASGKIRYENFREKHLLKRGGKVYAFFRSEGLVTFSFRECTEPYEITEF